MMVCLAASFAYQDKQKTEDRKAVLLEAAQLLEAKQLNVYLPQTLKIPNAWDYTTDEWGLMVFTHDLIMLDKSDIIVMLSFGKENNAGSAWEVGYAFGKGKKVIVVSMTNDTESIMVLHGSYAQVKGLNGLSSYDFKTMPKQRINTNNIS